MTKTEFLDGRVTLHAGDCREMIKAIPSNSIDSVVCDPPYALVSIVKRFGKPGAAENKPGVYQRSAAGFMGKSWDNGEAAFAETFWAEVLRVLKPGGHVLAFGGTRTYHRLAVAIEDAGFEIRDQIGWAYGSGFPKSHDVSKGIDRHNGDDRPVVGREVLSNDIRGGALLDIAHGVDRAAFERDVTSAASAAWEGWGTALKPAWEPIVMARKPLGGTVAENVLEHGTGALNIGGCRILVESGPRDVGRQINRASRTEDDGYGMNRGGGDIATVLKPEGRWPANIIHDGSDDVIAAFPDAPGQQGDLNPTGRSRPTNNAFGDMAPPLAHAARRDEGSAARFFYSAKADADDRLGSKHPTVKPIDLMQYLVRLVTPLGGTVLDPFAGTGTTGEAAFREGMRAVLIEREPEYQADIARRMDLAQSPNKRAAVARSKNKLQGAEGTPLFGGDAA